MDNIIKVDDAVGKVLLHDITKIDPDSGFKGRIFKKGHVIRKKDIKILKEAGKEHIYVFEENNNQIHENDCAIILSKALSGKNTYTSDEPKEGKISIYSNSFGVCKIDTKRLTKLNSVGEPSFATIYNNTVVKAGDILGAIRIISLFAPKHEIDEALNILKTPIVEVVPFSNKKAGLIVTGNEVYKGIIKDKFEEKLKPKLKNFLCDIEEKTILPDDKEQIKNKILEFSKKYDLVILSGGTSVDPDDVTYKAVKEAGVKDFIRGNPIQPGNMLTMGWIGNTPIVAVPAAAIFVERTAFDIWLPKFLIGEKISKEETVKRGHGGLL